MPSLIPRHARTIRFQTWRDPSFPVLRRPGLVWSSVLTVRVPRRVPLTMSGQITWGTVLAPRGATVEPLTWVSSQPLPQDHDEWNHPLGPVACNARTVLPHSFISGDFELLADAGDNHGLLWVALGLELVAGKGNIELSPPPAAAGTVTC